MNIKIFVCVPLMVFSLSCVVGAQSSVSLKDLSLGQTGKIYYDVPADIDISDILDTEKKVPLQKKQIYGKLYLPSSQLEKVPAVVIMHASGGVFDWREIKMAKELNKKGIAAFVPYSFASRGIYSSKQTYGTGISFGMRMVDAYTALNLLSSHPNVDSDKIAIMGYSSGGVISLLSSDEKIRKALAHTDLKFAAHVNVYASALFMFKNPTPTQSPMLVLIAEKDDLCSMDRMTGYVRKLKDSGANVHTIVYPGATHAFDKQSTKKVRLNITDNDSSCRFEILHNGDFVNLKNGDLFRERNWTSQVSSCATATAVSLERHPEAAKKYVQDSISFLIESFK